MISHSERDLERRERSRERDLVRRYRERKRRKKVRAWVWREVCAEEDEETPWWRPCPWLFLEAYLEFLFFLLWCFLEVLRGILHQAKIRVLGRGNLTYH